MAYRYSRTRQARRRKITNVFRFSLAVLVAVLLVGGAVWGIVALAKSADRGASAKTDPTPSPTVPVATPTATAAPTPTPSPTPAPTPDMSSYVPYTGLIEHIFVHPLVVYPELAFDGDSGAPGMDDYMTTTGEFKRMLEELYKNNYILIYFDQAYGTVTDDNGNTSYGRIELKLPEGKKPVVISTDDINYYQYMMNDGCNYKLVIGEDGHIAEMSKDPKTGEMVTTQGNEVFSILNQFLKEHPDFSYNGAKCYVGLTGYAGVLGYRTQSDRSKEAYDTDRQSEIEAAKPVIECLKNDGFKFASHSYAHGHMSQYSVEKIRYDCQKWKDEVESLVGPTEVFLFPYGDWPKQTSDEFLAMTDYGFKHFSGVGIAVYNKKYDQKGGFVFDDRKNIDGLTMRSCLEEGPNATKSDGTPTSRSQVWKMMDVEYVFESSSRGSVRGQGIGVR